MFLKDFLVPSLFLFNNSVQRCSSAGAAFCDPLKELVMSRFPGVPQYLRHFPHCAEVLFRALQFVLTAESVLEPHVHKFDPGLAVKAVILPARLVYGHNGSR